MIYYDLTGKRFGNLLVIKRHGTAKHRDVTWETLCDCGKEHVTRGRTLRNGTSISCGCRMSYRKNPIERFWDYVNKSDGCWEWKGLIMEVGYGAHSIKGKACYAHRFSYELHFGEIPNGKLICHSCDNRKCVNPSHLFVGSHLDNTKDMIDKKRNCKGTNVLTHKLKEEDVIKIRSLRKEGFSYNKIANQFGVCWSVARRICLNQSWRHIQ